MQAVFAVFTDLLGEGKGKRERNSGASRLIHTTFVRTDQKRAWHGMTHGTGHEYTDCPLLLRQWSNDYAAAS